MTIRSLTLVALVTVVSTSSGCSGMKNFMFGRGASCGLCNRARSIGTAINPLAGGPAAPGCRRPGCGLFGRNQAPGYAPPTAYAPAPMCAPSCDPNYVDQQGGYAGPGYLDGQCADQGYSAAMPGNCDCGSDCGGTCGSANNGSAAYQGGVIDPYLGNGGYSGGEIIQGDRFQPRTYNSNRFDEQGDRIISQDPMPLGMGPSGMGPSGMQFTN